MGRDKGPIIGRPANQDFFEAQLRIHIFHCLEYSTCMGGKKLSCMESVIRERVESYGLASADVTQIGERDAQSTSVVPVEPCISWPHLSLREPVR